MFGAGIPADAYLRHDFHNGIEFVGIILGEFLDGASEGLSKEGVRLP